MSHQKVSINNGCNWFEVYELSDSIYAICEAKHVQEVNSFLICGKEKALLFDTGLGFLDISKVARELYSGDIIVVNSHAHFDHIGNNHRFAVVHGAVDSFSKSIANSGLSKDQLGDQLDENMFQGGYPDGFDPSKFCTKPYNLLPVREGEIFDLGDRTLEVFYSPGHSSDGIMLYDRSYQVLFTGDTFYLGPLFAHFNNDILGQSDLKAYHQSFVRVLEKYPDVKYLCASHGDPVIPAAKLKIAAEALGDILDGKAEGHPLPDYGFSYLESETPLWEYNFDGFSVIV